MRRIQLVAITILVASVSVLAQNRLTQGSIYSCDDEFDSLSSAPEQPKFVWCEENQGSYQYTVSVIKEGKSIYSKALLNVECSLLGNSVRRCHAPVPIDYQVNASDILGTTHLTLSDGIASATSTAMQTATKTCRYFPPGVSYLDTSKAETRPLDTSIGGQMSGTIQEVAERIGQMRRDGWRVEWQWDSEDERVVVMMWCLGLPQ